MLKNLHERLINADNPLKHYGFSLLLIGIAGITISTISLKSSIKTLKILVKDKVYFGNEPYLAAVVVTLVIGIILLTWGFKNLLSSFMNMIRYNRPVPREFENYDEIENMLAKKQIPPYERLLETVIKKDKSFIKKFFFFLGVVIIGLVGRVVIPAEFFWNLRLTPTFFSFPLFFVVLLATVAGLRLASVYLYQRIDTQEAEAAEIIKSIKGEDNPYDFIPQIEKALHPLQRHGKLPFVFRSGFTETEGEVKNTGKIHKKIFSETYPQSIPYARHSIVYLLLFVAVMMFITGFLLLVKLPPDNISVLTVPIIAIDYFWTMVKGCILVFSGRGLLKNIYLIYSSYHFESVIVLVEVNGTYEKRKTSVERGETSALQQQDTQGSIFRNDCHFKIYAAKLLTETKASVNKRNVISMTVEIKVKKAKKLIVEAIETFGEKVNGDHIQEAPSVHLPLHRLRRRFFNKRKSGKLEEQHGR
jgi:hypothetical protein